MASHRGCGVSPPRPRTDSRRRTHRGPRSFPSRWRRWRGHRPGTSAVDPRNWCRREGDQAPAERSSRTTKTRASRRCRNPHWAGTRVCCWRRWSRPGRVRRPHRDTSRHTSSRTVRQRNARPARTDPERVRGSAAHGDLWRSAHHRADSQQDHSNHAPPGRTRTPGCHGPQRERSTPSTPPSRLHRAQ